MTLDEFFVALERTPRDWGFSRILTTHKGALRRGVEGSYQCPISAVFGGSLSEPITLATKNGIDAVLAKRIIDAADGCYSAEDTPADLALRAKLLKACGLAVQP